MKTAILLPGIDELPLTNLDILFFNRIEEEAIKGYFSNRLRLNNRNNEENNHVHQSNNSTPDNLLSHHHKGSIKGTDENNDCPRMPTSPPTTKSRGSWSQEEDQLLIAAVANCKPILWDIVAEKVPGRSPIQCKERWMYRLHPEVKKTKFERWEDEVIVKEVIKNGNHWTFIANKLPGRTSCSVKNRWYSVLRNRVNYVK